MAGEQVMVIGLGRFGSALARELERLGHEVMAVDRNEQRVNDIAPDVTSRTSDRRSAGARRCGP